MTSNTSKRVRTATGFVALITSVVAAAPSAALASAARTEDEVALRSRVTNVESYGSLDEPRTVGTGDVALRARVTHAESSAALRTSPHDVALRARVSEPASYAALRSAGDRVASTDIEEPRVPPTGDATDADATGTALGTVAALMFVAVAAFAVLRSSRVKTTA